MKRTILCIDLKSFYASCECLLLNKDPLTTPLVVASTTQGPGAITLAVTPYLKNKGIKSRGRLYEIPDNIKYIHIHPKMSYYMEKSKEVISVYLDFIDNKDLHVYSVDEAFLDITNYLKYYGLNEIELAKKIITTIKQKTGLLSTCGIGSNLFIAKTAMDTEAKKNKDYIAFWNELVAKQKIKELNKMTDMWGIGKNMEKRLNKIGIFSIKQLAESNKEYIISKLGIIGEELWNHANGIDEAIISENDYICSNPSYATSQILFKNYNSENIKIVIKETIEKLTKRLRENNSSCKKITIGIGYSLEINDGFNKGISLENFTRDNELIYEYAILILEKYLKDYPIRKLSISLSNIKKTDAQQLSLFENTNNFHDKYSVNKEIDSLQNKYGKNILLKTSSLLKDSTVIDRNSKLGGHSA